MEAKREYLGDGVYAEFDGYHVWLITNDGITDTNRIALEPAVYVALTAYVARLTRANAGREKGDDDGVEYADPRDAREERNHE